MAAVMPISPPASCHSPLCSGFAATNSLMRAMAVRMVSPWRSRNIRVMEPLAAWPSTKRSMSPGSDTDSRIAIRLPLMAAVAPSSS
jgi:hypothetical protein